MTVQPMMTMTTGDFAKRGGLDHAGILVRDTQIRLRVPGIPVPGLGEDAWENDRTWKAQEPAESPALGTNPYSRKSRKVFRCMLVACYDCSFRLDCFGREAFCSRKCFQRWSQSSAKGTLQLSPAPRHLTFEEPGSHPKSHPELERKNMSRSTSNSGGENSSAKTEFWGSRR